MEADESDGTLTKYNPFMSIILNVSKDHKNEADILELFDKLTSQSDFSLINADDKRLHSLNSSFSFGLTNKADWHPDTYELKSHTSVMTRNGIQYQLPLPGLHNLSNCAAALCACEKLGCDPRSLSDAVSTYQGVARRFTVYQTMQGVHVVDDFAHNPEKIKAAIKAARGISNHLAVIYQPHGFGPTRFLKNEYIDVFRNELQADDLLLLLPIYYAGGSANKDISSKEIIDELGTVAFEKHAPQSRSDIFDMLKKKVKPGECVLLMGARDPSLSSFARKITDLYGGITG